MSIFASILRMAYKLSGAKKAFALPEDALRKEIEKQNRHRGVFTPTERAILYFFGGGMVIGPDKGDLPVMRKLCRETGCENVPDYMLSGSRGDFTGVGDVHFFYSADEVIYGALPDFEEACKRANVPYTVSARPKMVHCYCMLPIFKEAKEDFAKIVEILEK